MTAADHRKAITRLLNQAVGRHRLWGVYAGFCEAAALSIANSTTPRGSDAWRAREGEYEALTARYGPDVTASFPRILAHLVEALTLEPRDQLGQLASELELLSKGHAQYFTPYDLSLAMCKMALDHDDLRETIDTRGYLTLLEPAAGAGGMVIAAAQIMRELGHNPQSQLHATCWDVEATAAHMCFIQLSLLHIPAVVVLGNTLTLEAREAFHTPAHVLGLWRYRLSRRREASEATQSIAEPRPVSQPALFGATP